MSKKPTYQELEARVRALEKAESEREKAKNDLQLERDKLRAIIENLNVGIGITDMKGNLLSFNKEGLRIHGLDSFEEMLPRLSDLYDCFEIYYPDGQLIAPEEWPFRKALRKEYVRDFELILKRRDKAPLHLKQTVIPIHDHHGRELLHTYVMQNITDTKQYETSLKAIEWLLKKSPVDAALITQPYGDLVELNRERLILDSVGAKNISDIVGSYLELLETSVSVFEQKGDYAYGILSSEWCRLLNLASRNLCHTKDNSEALTGGKWLCHESCWTDVSKVCIQTGKPVDRQCHGGLRIFGVPIIANGAGIGAINFGYGSPPDDSEGLAKIAAKFKVDFETLKAASRQYERRPMFLIEIAKSRLHKSAKLIGAICESRVAHDALQQEKEKLKVTLRSIGDGVITTDIRGDVVMVNRTAETLTGWRQEDAAGKPLHKVHRIMNNNRGSFCENPLKKILDASGVIELTDNTILTSRDGSKRNIAECGAPIIDKKGRTVGAVLVFRDITEKIKLEGDLRQAQKMEAIGVLAGGVAHEFNNVLSIILGNAELAMDDVADWQPVKENLSEIKQASLRARDVVKKLLSFSQKMVLRCEILDISQVVKETLALLRASVPANIRIRSFLPDNLDAVCGDSHQIHQLIINLCNNAVQAMENSDGVLAIALENVTVGLEQISDFSGLNPGSYVCLSIVDTGHGIPPDIQAQIFDPYFTTKGIEQRSGMGLAVVHGIVKSHKGHIIVDSRPKKGSTFYVYFPAHRSSAGKVPMCTSHFKKEVLG